MQPKIANPSNSCSVEITFNRNRGYAHIRFKGEVDIEAVNNAYLELINNPSFTHNINVCNDYSDAVLFISVQDIEQHSQFVAQYAAQRGCTYKLALVSNDTIGATFLNMYRVLISKTKVDCEQFSRTKSALRWLES